jgi:hypothetical protein
MSWIVPAALGAYHGLNPGMGWLFAVALGLQERRAAAVLRALPPIALGHAASVAIVVALAAGASVVVPALVLRVAGAVLLFAFAALLLLRRIHPRWVGMRLGARDLTVWSFVMSSAHGAGLMLLPVVVHGSGGAAPAAQPHAHAAASAGSAVLAIHTAAMFGAMAAAALLAFHVLGVGFLRRAWLNTDVLWAAALVASAMVLLFLG